jgi:hypothetical protein
LRICILWTVQVRWAFWDKFQFWLEFSDIHTCQRMILGHCSGREYSKLCLISSWSLCYYGGPRVYCSNVPFPEAIPALALLASDGILSDPALWPCNDQYGFTILWSYWPSTFRRYGSRPGWARRKNLLSYSEEHNLNNDSYHRTHFFNCNSSYFEESSHWCIWRSEI